MRGHLGEEFQVDTLLLATVAIQNHQMLRHIYLELQEGANAR